LGPARFELDFDPAVALKQLRREPELARFFRRLGPFQMNLRPSPTPFEALAESVTYQQLNGKAAASIYGRFRGLFPRSLKPELVLAMPEEKLREAGLSLAKTRAIRDLAEKTKDGLVPASWSGLRKMEDEAIVQRLVQVRGIGRWTVEMLLIFRLGRPDVWPVDDFAIRKGYGLLFGQDQPQKKEMMQRAEAWRPYRTVVAWYLWHSLAE
jgi:DNA-3-methyladenine glycosylase II